MSSILYRKGKGTVEHGIVCESTICEPGEVEGLLAAGWSANPPGWVPPEPVAVEPVAELVDPEAISGLKSELDSEIDNLKEQNRILTDLDEASKAEIQRLNSEVERLTGEHGAVGYDLATAKAELLEVTEERDALREEIVRLTPVLNTPNLGDEPPVDGDESNLNPVRLAAKEKGIEGWDTKRIATLEKMLEA